MSNSITLNRSLRTRVAEAFNAPLRMFCALMSSLGCSAMLMAPTLCSGKISTNLNMDNLFASMAGIIIKLAFYVGALITVGGIFSLIVAYKDDNADGQTRAVRLIVVGVVLVGFETILKTAGILVQ